LSIFFILYLPIVNFRE